MPAWRMISTASSALRAFTSSRLRCFISATLSPKIVVRLVELDARRGPRVVELGGLGDVVLHVLGDLVVGVDGFDRALGHAHGAVDALLGVDQIMVSLIVDAVNRARTHACGVLRADTRFGNNVGHYRSSSIILAPVPTSKVTRDPDVPGPGLV